jgi:SagB-type dehydrogenase family enzyme
LVLVLFVSTLFLAGEEMKAIQLKKPEFGKKPVLDILAKRQSMRDYAAKPLPVEVLSELLWAAWGINRESGKRTAPSAMNMQEIDVYVVMADGAYFYDAKENILKPVVMKDLREATGRQAFVKEAPLNIILVADLSKMTRGTDEDKRNYAGMDASFISENIYFYCAAEGLATVVRAMVDRDALAKALNLRPDQRVILAQTVGYPKN